MSRFSCLGLILLSVSLSGAETPPLPSTPAPEFAEAQAWFGQFQSSPAAVTVRLPFTFMYDGQPSAQLLSGWAATHSERALDAQRQERVLTFTDPKSGLQLRCVAVSYNDYPTVEWTLYFRNSGSADTPILADINAIDARWAPDGAQDPVLHHENGTFFPFSATDFMPHVTSLEAGKPLRLIPLLGRPSGGVMPYFNLARSPASGVIVVVGWPGAWVAEFARGEKDGVHVTAGQERVHLRLHPGEEIRSPLMVVQFWRGDWIGAQNTWRRWMQAHNLPKLFGGPLHPVLWPSSGGQTDNMVQATESNQLLYINRYLEEKFPIEGWWMDAGWYENAGRWQEPLAFRVDRKRFPRGLRYVTDYVHQHGLKTLLWFEPERIMPTNELFKTHPDWLYPNLITKRLSKLFYFGNPAALAWRTDEVSKVLDEEGIDVYRNDFNVVEPVELWRSNDPEDRQGIMENHHVVGYLAYYDELLRRHPGLMIDSCAGGGSRNDFETMRRALPFYRSDYLFDVVSNQCQSYGQALWLPFNGTVPGEKQFSIYELRSDFACPSVLPCWNLPDRTLPYDLLRKTVREWQEYAPNYFGDFYPLTPASLAPDVWVAWQFNRPEAGRGVVQAFRHDQSSYTSAHFKLRGLDPAARYRLADVDAPNAPKTFTGRELMETGFDVVVPEKPGAVIISYQRL